MVTIYSFFVLVLPRTLTDDVELRNHIVRKTEPRSYATSGRLST